MYNNLLLIKIVDMAFYGNNKGVYKKYIVRFTVNSKKLLVI